MRLIAFLISAAGYVAAVRVYWKISTRASYIFVFSGLALLMYLAGLAGVLLYAAYALCAGGAVFLAVLIATKKISKAYNVSSLSAINLAFVAVLVAMIASLINTKFVHYDNFSHWAVVVKDMLLTDRIPDAASAIIDLKSYPLGSSSFLYYVCRIVGNGEGVMLAGAGAPAVCPLLRGVRGHPRSEAVYACGAAGAGLLADVVFQHQHPHQQPARRFSAARADAGRDRRDVFPSAENFFRSCFASVPVLGLLVIVKNTGISLRADRFRLSSLPLHSGA